MIRRIRIYKYDSINNIEFNLDIIDKLNVVEYNYKDQVTNKNRQIGFIAQNIKEYIPNAVNHRTDVVPDIYKKSENVDPSTNTITLTNHGLNKSDKIKLININGNHEGFKVIIDEVIDENTFKVETKEKLDETVFIYGREVDDFHDLNYDNLTTVAISGIQQLNAYKKESAAQIATLTAQIATLTAQVNQLLNK